MAVGVFVAQPADAERQPRRRDALTSSNKTSLSVADAGKGGHRVTVLALVDQAIDGVKKGIAFDDTHSCSGIRWTGSPQRPGRQPARSF